MSYPSGATYTYPTYVSAYAPGLAGGGQDWVAKKYSSAADQTVSGISSAIDSGIVLHNYSGTNNYYITSATPNKFQVFDMFGKANAANITISGTSPCTINGATTATISSAYGQKTVLLVSGSNAAGTWLAF